MNGIYRFAERNIGITSIYDEVHRLCSGYIAGGSVADFSFATAQEDIEFERRRSAREDEVEGRPVRNFPDPYLETLAVYRKIAEKMPEYDTMLFHGSCIAVDGEGYLFTAKSGTGKSTHARLWKELLGEKAVMVNDDKPLIQITGNGAKVFGTPWDGKHRLSSNISVPLKALCVLTRAEHNSIRSVSGKDIYHILLQQAYRPAGSAALSRTLRLIDSLTENVGFWILGCNTNIEAAEIAYNAMKG